MPGARKSCPSYIMGGSRGPSCLLNPVVKCNPLRLACGSGDPERGQGRGEGLAALPAGTCPPRPCPPAAGRQNRPAVFVGFIISAGNLTPAATSGQAPGGHLSTCSPQHLPPEQGEQGTTVGGVGQPLRASVSLTLHPGAAPETSGTLKPGSVRSTCKGPQAPGPCGAQPPRSHVKWESHSNEGVLL